MSIQANMKPYQLSVFTETEDALGTIVKAYTDIAEIQVSISYTTMTQIENGLVYNVTQPIGITEYLEFDRKEKYRLVGQETYDIVSINLGGRYSQLILKEVLI